MPSENEERAELVAEAEAEARAEPARAYARGSEAFHNDEPDTPPEDEAFPEDWLRGWQNAVAAD